MNVSTGEHVALCHGCRLMRPIKQFKWLYREHLYCSAACCATAMRNEIPTPRKPNE